MTKPNLPPLPNRKSNRAITKHFTNLSMVMDGNRFALLSWLIYQSNKDNTFIWDGHLLDKYRASVTFAVEEYGGVGVNISPQKVRNDYKSLISGGWIFDLGNESMINPMLSYCLEYKRKYEEFGRNWQDKDIKELIEIWRK